MNVLLLHQHFRTPYQGGAIRSYYLARALVDAGIHPIVITAHAAKKYKTQNVDGIEVHYLPIRYDNRFGFYRRVGAFIRFAWNASRLAGKFRNARICYAMSVPLTVGIAARIIRWRYGMPFIFEVGDLWPDAPIAMGFIRSRWVQHALCRLEKSIYNQALALVGLSLPITRELQKRAPGKEIHLITNMADTEFFRPAAKDPHLVRKFAVDNKFVISYTGAVGLANGLDHFVACAKACHDAGSAVHFILCGEGALLETTRSQVTRSGLRNFSILPFQDRQGVSDVLNITDATFISYRPVPILETGSPNKYFDGLASGKLIIVNFAGWIREEIESNRCGIYSDPDQPASFVRSVTPFLKDNDLLKQYQRSARDLAEQKYSRNALAKKFARLISSAAEQK